MRAHLRVIWPDDWSPSSHRPLTLAMVFREQLLSRKQNEWDRRTIAEYNSTISLWEDITGDPPLGKIGDETLRAFADALARRCGRTGPLSPNTVRKHLRQLRAILRELGPRQNGKGMELIESIPWCPMPKPRRQPPVAWVPEDIRRLAEAGAHFFPGSATDPIPGPQWWRALLRILYNTAMRIGTALSLRWDWLDPDGWLNVPAESLKGKRIGRRFYLNAAVREELARLPRSTTGLILPWNADILTLQRWRKRLQKVAGLPTDFKHGFHAIRRAALSAVARINPLVARIVAGHSQGDVLLEYYISADVVAATLEKLPQPF